MSGYLRRQVQRTQQSAPAIRSTARLPYANPPGMDESVSILEDIDAGVKSPASTSQEAMHQRQPARTKMPLDDNAPPLMSSNQLDLEPVAQRPSSFTGEDRSDMRPEKSFKPAMQVDSEHETIESVSPSLSPTRTKLMQTEIAVPVNTPRMTASEISIRNDFEPLIERTDRVDNTINTQTIQKSFHPITIETSMQSDSSKQRSLGGRGQPAKSFESKVSDTHEVHVTIGRIEITAVHAPPASKPAPSAVRKTMSLDEYLAKRSRGSQ